jgi:hypothetical protein
MGCSFQPAARCGKRTEERRCENRASNISGSARRAANAKENPADLNRRGL